jgi:hypothetical protein
MENCVGFFGVLAQLLDGLGRRQDEQFDLAAFGFALHLFHHRQCARAGADDEPTAFPVITHRGALFRAQNRLRSRGTKTPEVADGSGLESGDTLQQ